MENIKSLKINYTNLNYNDIGMILEYLIWLNIIIWIDFTKITNDINLFQSGGSYFYLMINQVKEVLENRICTDYIKNIRFIR
jgi:hypothetical protein